MALKVVLVEPRIPPNTGNVARLCAAVKLQLHLVGPLGFRLTDRHLKRAGLDYWDLVEIRRHVCLEDFLSDTPSATLHFFSKKACRSYVEATFGQDDYLVFGSETEGLPEWLSESYPSQFWRIPIFEEGVRSLNLASAVAIVTYEALRQNGMLGKRH
jgi:tRNA (cytidine/uridine-2'-O-)-methyltransferase